VQAIERKNRSGGRGALVHSITGGGRGGDKTRNHGLSPGTRNGKGQDREKKRGKAESTMIAEKGGRGAV